MVSHAMNHEQDVMWESVQSLSAIDDEQTIAVLKAIIERSLQPFGLPHSAIFSLTLNVPKADEIHRLKEIEQHLREPDRTNEEVYEWLVEYIDAVSVLSKEKTNITRRRLLALLLSSNQKWSPHRLTRNYRERNGNSPYKAIKQESLFYTPREVANKLGLSDQTIRRMCEKGKFNGAYQTDGGHWKIPKDVFITTKEQDEQADTILNHIDTINKDAGDVDEFNL